MNIVEQGEQAKALNEALEKRMHTLEQSADRPMVAAVEAIVAALNLASFRLAVAIAEREVVP